jgi:hypothetical protein
VKKTFVFAVILITATLFAFAGSKVRKFEVSFSEPTTVAGVQLKAGTYEVEVNSEETVVTFFHQGSEVVKAAVHSQANSYKYPANELDRADQTLRQLHLGGTTTNLIIDGPAK